MRSTNLKMVIPFSYCVGLEVEHTKVRTPTTDAYGLHKTPNLLFNSTTV